MNKILPILAISVSLLLTACSDSTPSAAVAESNKPEHSLNDKDYDSRDDFEGFSEQAASSESNYENFSSSNSDEVSNPSDDNNQTEYDIFPTAISSSSTDESPSIQSSSAEEKTWRDYCLEVINNYRATEDKEPLKLAADSKQQCADQQAANDLRDNSPHGHFKDCNEYGQNSGPNINLSYYNTDKKIVDTYLKMMWDEKKLIESGERDPNNKDDYSYIGHYLNMSQTKFKSVACGIARNTSGTKGWFNVNFYY